MWDPSRDDPRFQQLMVKLGCVEEYKVARVTLARMLKDLPAGDADRGFSRRIARTRLRRYAGAAMHPIRRPTRRMRKTG
jgi:hypothetical protein